MRSRPVFCALAAVLALQVPPRGAGAQLVTPEAPRTVGLGGTYWRQLASTPPPDDRVWGIADLHTHPMAHLGFGALNGIPILWGTPGGAVTDYLSGARRVAEDIPDCIDGHGGGPTAEPFINIVEKRAETPNLWALVRGKLTRHARHRVRNYLAGAHQQMHVTQIHRAWHGGLRLMTAIAVHNAGAEFLASRPGDGRVPTTDRQVMLAQIEATRALARLNADWMEIAYSPADARRIIREGRLAVVLGVEVDQLDASVEELWRLGVRQVTPIHAADNRFGGAAVFEPAYNALNRHLNGSFFEVRDGSCRSPAERGECVEFTFDTEQLEPVLTRWSPFALFRVSPFFRGVDVPEYRRTRGHMNVKGLTDAGRAYLRALAARGMLIGLEHMSQRSVDDALEVLGDRPFLISHAHVRALARVPSEYQVSDRVLAAVARNGGMIGQFTAEEEMVPAPDLPRAFSDCPRSTTSMAYSLLYALRATGNRVGLATDFTFIPNTRPRFGEHGCAGQANPVRYRPAASTGAPADALVPYTMDGHAFDYNTSGFAHYGLLPDLLQDLKNLGLPPEAFEALFSSAETYIRTWERAAAAGHD